MISLKALLQTSVQLALDAGGIIRRIDKERCEQGENVLSAVLKEAGDSRSVATVADSAAQKWIVLQLRKEFGEELVIIGEEEEEEKQDDLSISEPMESMGSGYKQTAQKVIEEHLNALEKTIPSDLQSLPLSSIQIFVDPVDGTREFVEGRLQNVQTLIGITFNGWPCAGVMGLPFHPSGLSSSLSSSSSPALGDVLFAVVGAGPICRLSSSTGKVVPAEREGEGIGEWAGAGDVQAEAGAAIAVTHSNSEANSKANAEEKEEIGSTRLRIAVSAGPPSAPALSAVNALFASEGHVLLEVPACGNKVLSLVEGRCDVAVFNLKSSLWDTAATQALLCAHGGKMTDLFGCSINHRFSAGRTLQNSLGVLASRLGLEEHNSLAAKVRQLPEVASLLAGWGYNLGRADLDIDDIDDIGVIGGIDNIGDIGDKCRSAEASDVARDVHGQPLDVQMMSLALGLPVSSYSVPERDCHRYLMSEAARIHLKIDCTFTCTCKSLFFKRAVMRDLPHVQLKAKTAPSKLARDVKSYLIEASFLASNACKLLRERAHVNVPLCYRAELFPNTESPIDSKFSLLLEDFSPASGWRQTGLLTRQELLAGAKALARLHAFFWNGGIHNKHLSSNDVEQLMQSVWEVATHWAPSRQAPELMGQISSLWTSHGFGQVDCFGDGSDRHLSLGSRLQRVAGRAAQSSHLEGEKEEEEEEEGLEVGQKENKQKELKLRASKPHPYRTVIHGDAKSANLFFTCSPEIKREGEEKSDVSCALIDFQWAGLGLGTTDLAYYVYSCASPETLSGESGKSLTSSGPAGAEAAVLGAYHKELMSALKEFSRSSDKQQEQYEAPSLLELTEMFELAVLDVCRIAFAYHWVRSKASPAVLQQRAENTPLAPCAYNKNMRVARMMVQRCDDLLEQYE